MHLATPTHPSHLIRRARGFTLIELLIVISILGILAAVLLPQVWGTSQSAGITATKANMLMLETGMKTFQNKHGILPPDDFKAPETVEKAVWKADNGINTGIESLVCFLSQSMQSGLDLTSLAQQFTNTDGDDHGAELPLLKKRERIEIADNFGTPLVYFSKFGIERPQMVKLTADGDVVSVKAMRRPDGVPYGAGKFQLLSAGPDKTFGPNAQGVNDDICWPEN